MVDRRRLIIGGGAAAIVTTLAAAAGSPAGASSRRRVFTTEDHAHRVLDSVDVERGLVSPSGFQPLFDKNWETYKESPPRDPRADDLDAWTRQRMKDLCGTDEFGKAVTEIPEARALIAFSVVAYSQHQETEIPEITRSMPVPEMLEKLEPDFLPVLVRQIGERSDGSPEFAAALRDATAEVDGIIEAVLKKGSDRSSGRVAPSAMSDREMLEMGAGIVVFIAVMYWIKGGLK